MSYLQYVSVQIGIHKRPRYSNFNWDVLNANELSTRMKCVNVRMNNYSEWMNVRKNELSITFM